MPPASPQRLAAVDAAIAAGAAARAVPSAERTARLVGLYRDAHAVQAALRGPQGAPTAAVPAPRPPAPPAPVYVAPTAVRCPHCLAAPGAECTSPRGARHNGSHGARVAAAVRARHTPVPAPRGAL